MPSAPHRRAKGDCESSVRVAAQPKWVGEEQHKASLLPVISAVFFSCMGAFCFGYHLGVVNGPLAAIAADLGFAGNMALQGSVVSTLLAGAAVGSFLGSALADSLGRKGTLLFNVLPLAAGAFLSATAHGLQGMLVGRALAGLGIGLASSCVPLYISEVAPTALRGTFGTLNQLAICLGILGALVVNVVIPATAWRSMFYFAVAPAVLLFLGMLVSPESPRHLSAVGNKQEAIIAATRLWGVDGPKELEPANEPVPLGAAPVKEVSVGWGAVLSNRSVLIGSAMFLFQQLSGINAIVYFSSNVFAQAGVASGQLASAAVGVINVVGTLIATGLIDKKGRKQLLTLSFAGMGLFMSAMAAGLSLPQLHSISGPIALYGTLGYVLSFAIGAGPVPSLLIPEITPARIRGRAVSIALATHWVCNFALGQLFLESVAKHGVPRVYMFFASVCAVAILFQSRFVVETKGKSLEEIEAEMGTLEPAV